MNGLVEGTGQLRTKTHCTESANTYEEIGSKKRQQTNGQSNVCYLPTGTKKNLIRGEWHFKLIRYEIRTVIWESLTNETRKSLRAYLLQRRRRRRTRTTRQIVRHVELARFKQKHARHGVHVCMWYIYFNINRRSNCQKGIDDDDNNDDDDDNETCQNKEIDRK